MMASHGDAARWRGWPFSEAAEPMAAPALHWRSLQFFNAYKFVIAVVLLGGLLLSNNATVLGAHDRTLFLQVTVTYLIFGVVCAVMIRTRRYFNAQIAVQVVADIMFVTTLVYASRGVTSGLGLILLTTLAGAGLISRGRLALFYAALASIAILLEQGYEVLVFQESPAHFIQAGFLAAGYFATAMVAHTLARLTRENQEITARRDSDVANLSEVNRLVIEDTPHGVVVVEGGGAIRQINRRARALLGAEACEGERLAERAPALAAHLEQWRAGQGAAPAAYNVTMDDRHAVRILSVGAQRGTGAVIFLEDLTRAREQAQQMKLAAVGRLTANIAHEIRNPLASISHASQLLSEEPAASREMQRLVAIVNDNAQRLNRMVNDVLGLNRGPAAASESIALADFLRQFTDEIAETEGVDARLFTIRAAEDATVGFDRTHLHQVLWNLARNALRHCRREAGSIRLEAREVAAQRAVILDVIDDGAGVPPEARGGLFEPFVSGAPGGTGLGLYIARDLCAANGATLDFVETAAGACFRLTCRAGA
jgi:two-component system sensor histidine kinase PilS (NtrC family)